MSEPPPPPDEPSAPDQPSDPYGPYRAGEPPYPPPTWGPPGPGYGPPAYPAGPAYPGGPPPAGPPPGAPSRPGFGLTERLGARLVRRPDARFGVSLAAAGVVLAIVGVLVWTGGYLGAGLHVNLDSNTGVPRTSGEGRRFLGAGLSVLVAAAGYALLITRRRGPLATAGAIGAAIGIPLTLGFLTLDVSGLLRGQFPINIDLVFLLSALIWLVSYFVVPGARGRAFFLGLAATALATYFEYKAAGTAFLGATASAVTGSTSFGSTGTGGVAAVGLIFGIGYYLIAAFLDLRGRSGAAIALVYAGFGSTVTGVAAAAPSFHQIGVGVLLIVLGAALGWYGGRFGRRFTTWTWAAAVVIGIGLIVQKALPHSTTGAGITLIVIGALVVLGAQAVSSATREAPDIRDEEVPAAVR